jgi:hypothetical protein
MNKYLLRLKLEKLLPADDVADLCDAIMSSPNVDKIVDVVFDKGKITCVKLPWSPRENLKRAIRYYFESSCPMEMTTYTRLGNLAEACKKDFDKVVIEALHDMISDLEDL